MAMQARQMFEVVRGGDVAALHAAVARGPAVSLLASALGPDNLFCAAIASQSWPMFVALEKLAHHYALGVLLKHVNHDTGFTLLHTAARAGNLAVCAHLAQVVDPRMVAVRDTESHATPMLVACASPTPCCEAIVTMLLGSAYCDVTARDKHGLGALHRVAPHGAPRVLALLVATGRVSVATDEAPDGQTPLHYAARAANAQMVSALFAHGAVDRGDHNGRYAIHALCSAPPLNFTVGRVFFAETLQRLLAAGANVCSPHPLTGLRPVDMLPVGLRGTAAEVADTAQAIVLEMMGSSLGVKQAVRAAVGYGLCPADGSLESMRALFAHDAALMELLERQDEGSGGAMTPSELLESAVWKEWEPRPRDPLLPALWVTVLGFLDASDLFRASCVSRHWRQLSLDPSLARTRRSLCVQATTPCVQVLRHQVQPHDTLAGLCIRYDCKADAIVRLNHMSASSHSMSGLHAFHTELLIPTRVLAPRNGGSNSSSPARGVTDAASIARNLARAKRDTRRKNLRYLRSRFPSLAEEELAAYLDMSCGSVEQAITLVEQDVVFSEPPLSQSLGTDTLAALIHL